MKKKNKKHSPFATILIISSIILVLMLGGTTMYLLGVEIGSKREELRNTFDEAVMNLRINRSIKEQAVKDTLTYTLPTGWIEDTNSATDTEIILTSKDYHVPSTDEKVPDLQGASISLNVTPKYLFMTLGEIKRMAEKEANTVLTDTMVDGVPAIKSVSSGLTNYIIIKGKYIITIGTYVFSQEDKYTKDIDSFINSIQFK